MSERPNIGRGFTPLELATFGVALACIACFWPFVADDALIVVRYVRNLLTGHGTVYNLGEPINALTSPFHFAVMALFGALGLPELPAYRVVAPVLVFASVTWLVRRRISERKDRQVVLAMTLAWPPLLLWTVGGLETPLLVAAIAALTALDKPGRETSLGTFTAAMALSAICVTTRYDSAIYVGCVALGLLLRTERRGAALAVALAFACIPLAVLLGCQAYFGDILPTSFHQKGRVLPSLKSVAYFASFLTLSGTLALLISSVRASRPGFLSRLAQEARRQPGLACGLGLYLAYCLVNGAVHMMFGYRLFVPILAPLVVFLWPTTRCSSLAPATWLAPGTLFYQALLGVVMAFASLNPSLSNLLIPLMGRVVDEYGAESARGYGQSFLPALEANALAIKRDWEVRPVDGRPPRLSTYAAGVSPFYLPEIYVFESLVSYRHHCRINGRLHADYVQIISPRSGAIDHQLKGIASYSLVDRRVARFDGELTYFDVYRNHQPLPNPLPPRVDLPCLGADPAR